MTGYWRERIITQFLRQSICHQIIENMSLQGWGGLIFLFKDNKAI